ITVDDVTYSTNNWTNIDPQTSFSEDCIPPQLTYVPDDNFEQALVDLGYDSGALDDYVPTANINTVTSLFVFSKNISDMTGIEDFVALSILHCFDNIFTTINLSQNLSITNLYLPKTLINLDVSSNTELAILNISNNKVTSLDLSNNLKLTHLYAVSSKFTNLDLSSNTSLEFLNLSGSESLSELNVKNGNNTNVITFNLTNTLNLTCIEVDDATYSTTNWTNIDAQNSFSEDCSAIPLTYVPDDNFEQALIDLGYDSGALDDYVPTANINTITALDVSSKNIADLTGIQDFVALEELLCLNNQLSNLDISNNLALKKLSCYSNNLTNLNIKNNTALTFLHCAFNNLTTLDVSNNALLEAFNCASNELTILNVFNNTALTSLDCGLNDLVSLDVSNNNLLEALLCYGNNLTSLDVSNNILITALDCSQNDLTTINVSNNTQLQSLFAYRNLLTSLDVSNNVLLESLYCNDNQLTSLNVKNGNNTIIESYFDATNNDNLTCITVDDVTYSTSNWTIDPQTSFSEDCNAIPLTYVPDDNFEQALIDLGYDSGPLDDYVPTANINTITDLDIRNKNI
ncbi:chromosome condensation regulator RCC1, partial [Aureibaculum sp. A20]|nr:chromosome condensation regulator RCC1 [Aureibaculum flavum]